MRKSGRLLFRHRFAVLFIMAMLLLALVIRSLWLPAFYTYLDVSQPPYPADVIVILGGSGGPREEMAAALFHQGFAPTVLVSGQHDGDLDFSLNVLLENGIPASSLLVNDQANSTYAEAQQVLIILTNADVHSALIVTDPFHSRRARATYESVFRESSIGLTFVSSPTTVDAANWWQSPVSPMIWSEYPKMLYYWLAYGV